MDVSYEEVQKYLQFNISFLLNRNSETGLPDDWVPVEGPWTWPTPGYYYISSSYGMRQHPTKHIIKNHPAIDIGAPFRTAIVAAKDGIVTTTGYMGDYGNTVKINHGNATTTQYSHMILIATQPGARVKAGDVIGFVGSTGASTGPHLHFEVRRGGSPINPINLFGGFS